MSDDNTPMQPQSSQHVPTDIDMLDATQDLIPLPANAPQGQLVLPGQSTAPPTMYSDHTIPINVSALPSDSLAKTIYPSASPGPKSEHLDASAIYPPIPAAYPDARQIPQAPLPKRGGPRFSKDTWWIALPIGVAVIALVLALLVIPVSAFWLPRSAGTASKALSSQPTTIASSPMPTLEPTPVPTLISTPAETNSAFVDGISLTPNRFDIQNDCQSDDGYHCTAILALSSDADTTVSWTASVDGVDSNIHPRHGQLDPGQQLKIIIYLQDSCPIDAVLTVVVPRHGSLSAKMQCS